MKPIAMASPLIRIYVQTETQRANVWGFAHKEIWDTIVIRFGIPYANVKHHVVHGPEEV